MPTSARLKLEFEEGQCPHCGAAVELEFGGLLEGHVRPATESSPCPECGGEIVSERRGSRFWYTPHEFAEREIAARRLIRCSRQWFALAVELRLAAVEMMGAGGADLGDQFEQAEAALRRALAPALDRARDEVAQGRSLPS
jgi:endogenous inhibitor of DNA gyrase (YacG/DUF329 family)